MSNISDIILPITVTPIEPPFAPTKLDAITTVDAQATYALARTAVSYTPNSALALLVSYNGVIQEPNIAFTVTGSNITFAFAVSNLDTIDFIIDLGKPIPINSITGNSITDLGDVSGIVGPTNGQILAFNSTSSLWEPLDALPGGVDGVVSSATGTALTIDAANDVVASGTFTATTLVETSSLRYKDNVRSIEGTDALEAILALRGVTYDRKDGTREGEVGLIAEEVIEWADGVVELDSEGRPNAVMYTRLVPYLLEAIKELSAQVEELKGG